MIAGKDGQARNEPKGFDRLPGKAEKEDLFLYGTMARVVGVHGTRSDLALIVEGFQRFKINRIKQDRPFFEAKVTYLDEECMLRQAPL